MRQMEGLIWHEGYIYFSGTKSGQAVGKASLFGF